MKNQNNQQLTQPQTSHEGLLPFASILTLAANTRRKGQATLSHKTLPPIFPHRLSLRRQSMHVDGHQATHHANALFHHSSSNSHRLKPRTTQTPPSIPPQTLTCAARPLRSDSASHSPSLPLPAFLLRLLFLTTLTPAKVTREIMARTTAA